MHPVQKVSLEPCFFYNNLISSPVDIQLFTDAAPSIGYGGFYQGRWFASTWPRQLSNLPQSSTSSALFELYPIVIAAFLWGKEWSATSIIIHCDNEATVHCVNKSRSHSPMLNPIAKTFDLDFSLRPIHHNRKTHSRVKKSNS